MGRLSGRWLGIGIAVLVVGALALIAAGSGGHAAAGTGPVIAGAPATSGSGPQPAAGMSVGALVGVLLKVGIVAVLLGASLWLLRRYAGTSTRAAGRTGAVHIADTIPIAQGRAIYVVDLGDRALVVGATPQQFNLLGEMTDPATLAKLRSAPERSAPSLTGLPQRFTAALQGFTAARAAQGGQPADAPARRVAGSAAATFAGTLDAITEASTPDLADLSTERAGIAGWMYDPSQPSSQPGAARLRALAERLRTAREAS